MYFAKVEAHVAFLYKIHPAMRHSSGFILTIEVMDSAQPGSIPQISYQKEKKAKR